MTRTILAVTTLAALVACASSPPPASPPEPAAKAAASPARLTYRIVEVSDTSALGAKRFVYRVRVSRPVSEAEVRAMSSRPARKRSFVGRADEARAPTPALAGVN